METAVTGGGRREIGPVQAGVVLGSAFLVVYLLTRTRDLGGDDTVFALAIEAWLRRHTLWWDFFHPHHVLYNPLVALVTAWGRRVIPGLLAVDAGAAVSAVFGAATVGLTAAILQRRGYRAPVALLSAAVMGFAGGFWQFSTRLEVYTLAAFTVTLWLAVVSRERPSPLGSGLAQGFAMLGHLAMGVLLPATFLRTAPPWRRRASAVLLGLSIPSVVLGAVFLLRFGLHPTAWLHGLIPSSYEVYMEPSGGGRATGALAALLWWGWYRHTPVLLPAAARIFDAMAWAAAAAAALVLSAGLTRLRAPGARWTTARTALLGLAGFVPLWLVWDTGNVEHTVASAPLWAALLAAGAEALPSRLGTALLGLLALLLAGGNGLGGAIPQSRPENGRIWVIASFVRETVPEGATVLSAGADPRLRLGLQYLSGRHVVDLTLAADSARQQGRDPRIALAYWLERAHAARTVWLLPDVLDPATAQLAGRLGIPAEAWRRATAGFRVLRHRTLAPDGVVIRTPFVLTLARAP